MLGVLPHHIACSALGQQSLKNGSTSAAVGSGDSLQRLFLSEKDKFGMWTFRVRGF